MGGAGRGTWMIAVAGVVLAVAACGSDSDTTSTSTAAVVIAPVATTGGPDAPAPTPPAGAVAAGPADALFAVDLPVLDGTVPTFEWTTDRRPTRDDLDALAAALGIRGDVEEGIPGGDGGWVLDGDNLTLTLDGGIEGAWSYSGPPPFDWPSETEPWPTIETGEPVTVAPTFPAPSASPPDDYPTPDEARALAESIVESIGFDPAGFNWRSSWRGTSPDVEAWWVIDGAVSPVKMHFAFGAEGRLLYASGQLVAPAVGAPADRIGTAAAVERLLAEIERVRSTPIEGMALVGDLVAPGSPDASVVLTDAATPPPIEEPVVHPTAVPPTTVPPDLVGRIVAVEPSWQVVRDGAGTRLNPAYTFIEATGMRYTVAATA